MNALYLLGSLLGVGLLVGLNLLLMGRTRARFDLAAAAALLAAEHPGFRAGAAIMADADNAALIEDARGALYLVAAFGDRMVSRKLAKGQVASVARDGKTLTLRFRDFTFPRAQLALQGDTQAEDWERRLARALG